MSFPTTEQYFFSSSLSRAASANALSMETISSFKAAISSRSTWEEELIMGTA